MEGSRVHFQYVVDGKGLHTLQGMAQGYLRVVMGTGMGNPCGFLPQV